MKFSQPQLDPVIKQLIGDLICVKVFSLNLKFLLNSGANIVDIGGESTKPGSKAINSEIEWSRIKNIINNHHDIYWIIVSKHKENMNIPNGLVYNQINQIILSELYNCADFFIIGSPSETQCLAAIECCLCDVPIIMRDTGFVTNLSSEEKNQIGIIGDNLEQAVYTIKNNEKKYIPRKIVEKYYSIDEMCNKWINFLDMI